MSHAVSRRGAVLILALALCVAAEPAHAQWQSWMLGPFVKQKDANPILAPSDERTMRSAFNDSLVRWEGYATFNPAAVVKDGKVYVLYRAEDATGRQLIGDHTSRLGLAV